MVVVVVVLYQRVCVKDFGDGRLPQRWYFRCVFVCVRARVRVRVRVPGTPSSQLHNLSLPPSLPPFPPLSVLSILALLLSL